VLFSRQRKLNSESAVEVVADRVCIVQFTVTLSNLRRLNCVRSPPITIYTYTFPTADSTPV